MALWDKISFGFDAEDETVNFGKRSVVEQATSIYESSTLATIQPNQPVYTYNNNINLLFLE